MQYARCKKDVIIACDFPSRKEALGFLALFESQKPFVKIGMELFYGEGPALVEEMKALGHPVFLDLKLHDIPNTVKRAMANIARLGVDMTNVHAAGTRAMMEAAREGLIIGGAEKSILLAVTQLTSTSEIMMQRELLINASLTETVLHYAKNVMESGLSGIVCSPLEVRTVKEACGNAFIAVTPGIRYADGDAGDQARITTPCIARELGSDYIVVGRPITAAPDPVAAYMRIVKDFLQEEPIQ